jgi:hypothetical protein
MNTRIVAGGLLALALTTPAFADTSVSIGFSFNTPPPPVVVYRQEPRWVFVPQERVYIVADDNLGYDYFHYGSFYYIYDNDYWYRSSSFRGPFVAVRTEFVPESIWAMTYVPTYRWRHQPQGMPSAIAQKFRAQGRGNGGDRGVQGRQQGQANGQGRGEGKGKGQGKGHGHN